MAETGLEIDIRHLYKIFGRHEGAMITEAQAGIGKAEMLARHGQVLGLSDISLKMEAGRIQVVMGLSGSGKSTLIRHINRLIDPSAGEILVAGQDVTRLSPSDLRRFRRECTAMVFQRFGLLPHRTVFDNVVYGLTVQGMDRAEQRKRAAHWIARVGLDGYEDRFPNQLSGGMQQRVGLARALANDAPILLMDEAFSALDPLIRVDMQTMLLDLQAEIRKTVVFITHDLDEALRLGDRIAILKDGEIVQNGTAEDIVLTPADAYVESFVREVNRGRVIRLQAVMRRLAGPVDGLPRLSGELSLEDAAGCLTRADALQAVVLDPAGEAKGLAGLVDIVGGMVRPGIPATATAAAPAPQPPASLQVIAKRKAR